MMQPKRASGRLEIKRKEQEDKDKELAEKVILISRDREY